MNRVARPGKDQQTRKQIQSYRYFAHSKRKFKNNNLSTCLVFYGSLNATTVWPGDATR
jgi:hypothetical protein